MPSFYMNAPDCICSPGRLPLGAFCAGRDDLEREALHDDRISIRAPRAGCDQAAATKKGFMSEFQSTRPVWGATRSPMWRSCSSRYFNPRAPCGARRTRGRGEVQPEHISIHAPRVGRDSMRSVGSIFSYYFNPRAPCGARPVLTGTGYKNKSISIHAPRVGRDCPGRSRLCRTRYFNPRAPCGARQLLRFSVHKWSYFNPRAPCGARRGLAQDFRRKFWISIHAPRVGRDVSLSITPPPASNFNPRAPCGARPANASHVMQPIEHFNPRAPCGARHERITVQKLIAHFNPRAPCGARQQI